MYVKYKSFTIISSLQSRWESEMSCFEVTDAVEATVLSLLFPAFCWLTYDVSRCMSIKVFTKDVFFNGKSVVTDRKQSEKCTRKTMTGQCLTNT